jgi:hypothetical protein
MAGPADYHSTSCAPQLDVRPGARAQQRRVSAAASDVHSVDSMALVHEKQEADVMEHVFLGVRTSPARREARVISLGAWPWLAGVAFSAIQISELDEETDEDGA